MGQKDITEKHLEEYNDVFADIVNVLHFNGGLVVPANLRDDVSDYKINIFEIAYLNPEQVAMFQSDFKFVADYFVQLRITKDYVPSKETMEHVDAVLKIMSVLTKDVRFEEAHQNGMEVKSMCEVLDRAENRGIQKGILETLISLVKDGILTIEEAASRANMAPEDFQKKMREM